MDERIKGRIIIDGLVFKDINQVFQRLFKINGQYGEDLNKDDWNLIFEHTKSQSYLIPPANDCKDTIDPKPWLKSLGETYYVVERFDRYVDGVYSFFASEEPYEKTVRTTESLLDCYRYETYEQAKEFADKYNCNVRKVIVKVEE